MVGFVQYGYQRYQCWASTSYDKVATSLEAGDSVEQTFGLRGKCSKNNFASSYATRTFVPDLMHDFLGKLNNYIFVFQFSLDCIGCSIADPVLFLLLDPGSR
jgi:hypothetical protein